MSTPPVSPAGGSLKNGAGMIADKQLSPCFLFAPFLIFTYSRLGVKQRKAT